MEKESMKPNIVGLEAQLVVTTRNKERIQCYNNNDYVTWKSGIVEAITAQLKCKFKITKTVLTTSNTLPKK